MFYVGQKVVCIDSSGQDALKEGNTYTITETSISKCCGILNIGVGIAPIRDEVNCIKCGMTFPLVTNHRPFLSRRFVPLQDWEQSEQLVNKLIEESQLQEL